MKKELNTCSLCGGKYEGYGNSTWGWWEMTTGCSKDEDSYRGEKERCCDECNVKKVVPARIYLYKMSSNGGSN